MPLHLMYITNQPRIARIAENAGVDWIFVDMEYIGKAARQGGMDTVQSHHTLDDVACIRHAVTRSELLVRCNPMHDAGADYGSSEEEIDGIIARGADIIMLPFFKTEQEVVRFLSAVRGRTKTMLLFETPESVEHITDILSLPGIDFVHIGLNDLSLGYHKKFMFELLADGTVETIAQKIKATGVPFGFGGIASLGRGLLPAEYIIREHYRLGSSAAILSRSFCNCETCHDIAEIERTFREELSAIRRFEEICRLADDLNANPAELRRRVQLICGELS